MTTTEDSLSRMGLTPADLGMNAKQEDLSELDSIECPKCTGRGWSMKCIGGDTYKADCDRCKGTGKVKVSELTLAECEAWIKREYPSAHVIQSSSTPQMVKNGWRPFYASATELCTFNIIRKDAETPLLALQNVISQIIKWRNERGNTNNSGN